MPHAPLAAVLSLVLVAAAGQSPAGQSPAGTATPAVAAPDAPAAVIGPQPDLAIDWRSLQDIVLERLRDTSAPTGAPSGAATRPLSVQCLTTDGSCSLSVDSPVAFGLPCRCDGSDAPGTIR